MARSGSEMCDMRGMLSFMVLWLLSKRPMHGQELATEIQKRKGDRPNPGTIYPALKGLTSKGLVTQHSEGRNRVYELTPKGRETLGIAVQFFKKAYGEIVRQAPAARLKRRAV